MLTAFFFSGKFLGIMRELQHGGRLSSLGQKGRCSSVSSYASSGEPMALSELELIRIAGARSCPAGFALVWQGLALVQLLGQLVRVIYSGCC